MVLTRGCSNSSVTVTQVPPSSGELPCVQQGLWFTCNFSVGRLLCGHPEANGDLLSQTRDSFEPSCWAVVKCTSDRPVLAVSAQCGCGDTSLTPAPLLASKAHPCELAGAELAVTPLGWRVRRNMPDTNSFSKVSHRLGWGLRPVYLAAGVLPGLGNP